MELATAGGTIVTTAGANKILEDKCGQFRPATSVMEWNIPCQKFVPPYYRLMVEPKALQLHRGRSSPLALSGV